MQENIDNNNSGIIKKMNSIEKVDAEIKKYINDKILPQYAGIGGHTDKHIQQVITRSLRFAEQVPEVNLDMVYAIAAYHDLGRLVDNETHNIESAKMLREDEFLKTHFSVDEIETMAEAVEDHRASLGHEPRNIYGKIVSSADRVADMDTMLSGVFDYNRYIYPELTEDEVIEKSRLHLRRKYSPDGYAAKTMYFDDPDFAGTLKQVEEVTRDAEKFAKIMREHNKKRGE